MKKMVLKKSIVFITVCFLVLTPTLSFSGGGNGGEDIIDPGLILVTTVFVIWTSILISGIMAHSNLGLLSYAQTVGPLSIVPLLIALSVLSENPLIASIVLSFILSMAIMLTIMAQFPYGTVVLAPALGLLGLSPFTITSLSNSPSALLIAGIISNNFSLIFTKALGIPPSPSTILSSGQKKELVNKVITPGHELGNWKTRKKGGIK